MAFSGCIRLTVLDKPQLFNSISYNPGQNSLRKPNADRKKAKFTINFFPFEFYHSYFSSPSPPPSPPPPLYAMLVWDVLIARTLFLVQKTTIKLVKVKCGCLLVNALERVTVLSTIVALDKATANFMLIFFLRLVTTS